MQIFLKNGAVITRTGNLFLDQYAIDCLGNKTFYRGRLRSALGYAASLRARA